ncbi:MULTISPECIES: inositol monophosphatase family protein [Inquilinus]|uniref:Fructose-1,6-bisphosphatase/inositol monophosphatase family enzyme n=1 Tax=Inquilinus ginsengisoli TaxID=363840 RepID=A0ABU1JN92_9PROT|nr:inositol monophosphatase family protein [Inquilinus ginsengisoli]MDR6290087.1 fructose-1,6-bisphosphatase/inositol monophosphatase family enzyme [Inquilinus ginsengisoli]
MPVLPIDAALIDRVAELLRHAAREAILPRFRALAEGEAEEKSPGEIVTIADREAEAILTHGLSALRPGVLVLGEEAAAADPGLLPAFHAGDAPTWLVDPLDGTANFAAGNEPFAVMVALVEGRETVAAWMLDPVADRLAVAVRGGGAFLDGARIRTPQDPAEAGTLRGAVLTRFLPPPLKAQIEARSGRLAAILPGWRCSGRDYPDIATGEQDFVLFWRGLPWDHAPGALFLEEAGGRTARLDGAPYRPRGDLPGLLVARSPAVWATVAETLLESTASA